MEIPQLELRIHGEVQGVFFRSTVQQWCRELGLTGYVTNNPDGTVSLVAQGSRSSLKQLLERCQAGPTHAHVANIEQHWGQSSNQFATFDIR